MFHYFRFWSARRREGFSRVSRGMFSERRGATLFYLFGWGEEINQAQQSHSSAEGIGRACTRHLALRRVQGNSNVPYAVLRDDIMGLVMYRIAGPPHAPLLRDHS